jgi:hypothetical protein
MKELLNSTSLKLRISVQGEKDIFQKVERHSHGKGDSNKLPSITIQQITHI